MVVIPARTRSMPSGSQAPAVSPGAKRAKGATSVMTSLIVLAVLYFDSLSAAVRFACAAIGAAPLYYLPFAVTLPWVIFRLLGSGLPPREIGRAHV